MTRGRPVDRYTGQRNGSDSAAGYISAGLHIHDNMEDEMGNLVGIGQFWGGSFGFFGGMGVFFIGVGVLWWISLQAQDRKK